MKRFVWIALALALATPAAAQTPNRGDVVQALASSGPGAALMQACKTSKEACGQFTRLAACTLAPEGFGLLTKNPGENQFNGFAVDAIIFRTTSQVIDIISANESPNAGPSWTEVQRRPGNIWAAPVGCGPIDPPPPPPSTEVLRAIAALNTRLTDLGGQIDTLTRLVQGGTPELVRAIDDLRAEVNALRSRPITFPVYKGRVLGQPFTLTPQQ